MELLSYEDRTRELAPSFAVHGIKRPSGSIGVVGGSLEYTGPPYFAGVSALKVGAESVHIFCPKDAGVAIKSYNPDLVVHPVLDDDDAVSRIEPWLQKLNVIVIGCGLGREPETYKVISQVISLCRTLSKPLIIDGDALFFLADHPDIIKDYPEPGVILTPNNTEYLRLYEAMAVEGKCPGHLNFGPTIAVLRKGCQDRMFCHSKGFKLSNSSSGKRCAGEGDLIAGALGIFYYWAITKEMCPKIDRDKRVIIACYAACKLIRKCNERAFYKKGRSMLCSDMIEEINGMIKQQYEPFE